MGDIEQKQSGVPLLLRQAATAAVSQWRYKPALLNGTPVDSPTQIVLNFLPDR